MAITAAMVKELRDKTGAGMLDCKKALEDAEGNMEKAIDILKVKGLSAAADKADRIATEGVVDSYIHAAGRIGVLVEVNCETDFVANTDQFRAFVKDIAMQIAADNPKYVSRDDVPEDVLANERDFLRRQALNEGKPENIVDKMVEGRLNKFYEENCLLDQQFIKDSDKKISTLINEIVGKVGENVTIRRFARFELGEGLEKKEENFADEVMAQIKQ